MTTDVKTTDPRTESPKVGDYLFYVLGMAGVALGVFGVSFEKTAAVIVGVVMLALAVAGAVFMLRGNRSKTAS